MNSALGPLKNGSARCLDADGDSRISAFDLASLLGNWGPNPNHPADLNDDDIIDAFDLALLLGNWGPCE